jgi:AraC-like DNA-binding protein
MSGRDDERFTLPAVHALHLADLVASMGIATETLLADAGLDRSALTVPGAVLAVSVMEELVTKARTLTRNEAIGIQLGLEMRASAHGYLGFAAMTASTLREALETATRFVPTRTNALGLRLQVEERTASLVIDERADFGSARDVILFAITIGIRQIGNALTGRDLKGSFDFAIARPSYLDRFASFEGVMRFAQPTTRLVFDASDLDLPLTMSDPVSRKIAYSECERSLEELGEGEVLARVRDLVARDGAGFRSLEEIAMELRFSARTLKRRLATAGVTYSDVLAEQRRDTAIRLLRSQALSLDEVAERLGYSDTSNFRRAFRRWTGMSPAAYRRAQST